MTMKSRTLQLSVVPSTDVSRRGFTIVELLIVIVVIGILAAITVVAYNGIQDRAKNTQTVNAASAWLKAMKMYKIDNGSWPSIYNVCLGEGYMYGVSGTEATGIAQCRQDNSTWGVKENPAFNNALQKYLNSSIPTPAFVTAVHSNDIWKRGITYFQGAAGQLRMDVTYAGVLSTCPAINGVTTTNINVWGGNTNCHYEIGNISDR